MINLFTYTFNTDMPIPNVQRHMRAMFYRGQVLSNIYYKIISIESRSWNTNCLGYLFTHFIPKSTYYSKYPLRATEPHYNYNVRLGCDQLSNTLDNAPTKPACPNNQRGAEWQHNKPV